MSSLDAFAPRERAALAGIMRRLGTIHSEDRDGLHEVLPELRKLLGGETGATYGLRAEDGGYAMERLALAGELPPRFMRHLEKGLCAGPRSVLLYDPAAPEPRQRNRARAIRPEKLGEAAGRLFDGWEQGHQLRVLLCDGPGLLAWIGVLAQRPFRRAEVRMLEALTPALLRRARVDRLQREGEGASRLLEAAVDHIGRAALVLVGSRVVHANAAAGAMLARDRRATLEQVAGAARGVDPRWEVAVHRAPGAPEHLLAVARAAPDVEGRVAAARRRWSLTPRQAEVLALVAQGLGNKGLAAALRCTEKNVEFHLSRLLERAGCSGRAELLARLWAEPG